MKLFIFDHALCNGCHNCQIACKDEHCGNDWSPYAKPQPQTGQFWIKVNEKIRGQVPKVKASYTVDMCRHCAEAPCVEACPDAVYRRDDGLVLIRPNALHDKEKLLASCPYTAIYWNEELAIAQKCTGCAHLLDDGWEVPRCVDVCPHGALRFVDEEELTALDKTKIATADNLQIDEVCKPRVHYFNAPKRFIGGIVVDLQQDEVLIDATVTLEDASGAHIGTTTTDEFGDFWFHQVESAVYRVHIEFDKYQAQVVEVDTTNDDRNIGIIAMYSLHG